jgi:hypothetical protein
MKIQLFALVALILSIVQCPSLFAQGTAFSFESQLPNNVPDGHHSIRFQLANSATGANYIGIAITNDVMVKGGEFSTTLDFGNVFDGSPRWVEISVARNFNKRFFEVVTPRVELLPVPYAIFANTASNFVGTISGDVTGTQNATVVSRVGGQSAADIANGAIAANNFLHINGNAGNTAIGDMTLGTYYNNTGSSDTAIGTGSLFNNTSGNWNTALGYYALDSNQSGGENTAVGFYALLSNVTNSGNTAIGTGALGFTRGNRNIGVGNFAGQNNTSGDDNIDIGNQGDFYDYATIRIGDTSIQAATFIAGIAGATISGGAPVYVNTATGQLGIESSSARFKDNIQDMGNVSDVLLALKPVTFQYKPGIDPKGTPQFGLVAEQVEKVDPDLVVRDKQHGIYTVRYEAINAMLLNEFLKEHQKIDEQNKEIQILQQNIAELRTMVLQLPQSKTK